VAQSADDPELDDPEPDDSDVGAAVVAVVVASDPSSLDEHPATRARPRADANTRAARRFMRSRTDLMIGS
jgi:hypothetical protein